MTSTDSHQPAGHAEPAVIHDLGYRPYTGPRLGTGPVSWSFFVTGLLHAFGIGRSGRSKILPMTLLGLAVTPAVILVGVLVVLGQNFGLTGQIVSYTTYPMTTQILTTVFVAAQAPVLVSRDLRFGTITLYLARPMGARRYVLVRLASLATAVLVVVGLPLLVLYAGGLLADLPAWQQTKDVAVGLLGALLLALVLASVSGLVAATTLRRGLASAVVVTVLFLGWIIVSTVQGISRDVGRETVGWVAGLFSPYTLVNGLMSALFEVTSAMPVEPRGAGWALLYLLWTLASVAAPALLMLARYRKASS